MGEVGRMASASLRTQNIESIKPIIRYSQIAIVVHIEAKYTTVSMCF